MLLNMKFLLRTIIIFISYECFCYGGSDSDSENVFFGVNEMNEETNTESEHSGPNSSDADNSDSAMEFHDPIGMPSEMQHRLSGSAQERVMSFTPFSPFSPLSPFSPQERVMSLPSFIPQEEDEEEEKEPPITIGRTPSSVKPPLKYYDDEIKSIFDEMLLNKNKRKATDPVMQHILGRQISMKDLIKGKGTQDVTKDSSKDSVKVKLLPRLVHETTKGALMNMYSLRGQNLEKEFRKTGMCAHYTALDFINNVQEFAKTIIKDAGKDIDNIYNTESKYVFSAKLWKTHIKYPDFDKVFKDFYDAVVLAARVVTHLWLNADVAVKLPVLEYFNKLILDTVLNCEVPVSKFLEYSSPDVNEYLEFLYSLESPNESSSSSSGNTRRIKFHATHLLQYPGVQGSMACYMSRLFIVLSYLNNEVIDDISWDNEDVNNSVREIYESKWFFDNEASSVLMFPHVSDHTWKALNTHVTRVIEFLFSNIKYKGNIKKKIQPMENVIKFYDHSLLECKVPMKYFLNKTSKTGTVRRILTRNFEQKFRSYVQNYSFFDNYNPYTVNCLRKSIYNMFKELSELNTNCENQMRTFTRTINIKYHKTAETILEMRATSSEFGKHALDLDKMGVDAWHEFEKCLYTGIQNIVSHRLEIINIVSRFQNFYKSCGVPPVMMEVYWNELTTIFNE